MQQKCVLKGILHCWITDFSNVSHIFNAAEGVVIERSHRLIEIAKTQVFIKAIKSPSKTSLTLHHFNVLLLAHRH